jgi:hypothetical protein
MTIWTDLQTLIDAKAAALGYTGTLAELGIDQPFSPTLANLLALQAELAAITGSSGDGGGSQPATTRTTSVICLTTALSESSIALSAVKILELDSRTNTPFRFAFTANNTINTQNFTTVRTGNQEYQPDINFTGTIFFSAETLPTPVDVAACSTTDGSPTVSSANSFNAAVIGQAVSGTGIPANTFVIRRAANGLSITLGDANGTVVNATANATSSATLTFSGAVIRVSRWT